MYVQDDVGTKRKSELLKEDRGEFATEENTE